MSTKHFTYDSNGKPQKMAGWFSWRHQSNAEHIEASERYQAEHGRKARQAKAAERARLGRAA